MRQMGIIMEKNFKSILNKIKTWHGVFLITLCGSMLFIYLESKETNLVRASTKLSQADSEIKSKSFVVNLGSFPKILKPYFYKYLDFELINSLESCKNLEEAALIIYPRFDMNLTPNKIKEWLDLCQGDLNASTWGGLKFNSLPIKMRLDALGTYLVREKKFKHSDSFEAYSLASPLESGIGNCVTLTICFILLADRFQLPVRMVSISHHVFARYDDGKTKMNIECTLSNAMGVGIPDSYYLNRENDFYKKYRIPNRIENSSMMKSLTLKESLSILFLTNTIYLEEVNPVHNTKNLAMAYFFNQSCPLVIDNTLRYLKLTPFISGDFEEPLISYLEQEFKKVMPIYMDELEMGFKHFIEEGVELKKQFEFVCRSYGASTKSIEPQGPLQHHIKVAKIKRHNRVSKLPIYKELVEKPNLFLRNLIDFHHRNRHLFSRVKYREVFRLKKMCYQFVNKLEEIL